MITHIATSLKFWAILFLCAVLLSILGLIVLVRLKESRIDNTTSKTAQPNKIVPLAVINTSPKTGETHIYPGEIPITFEFNQQVYSDAVFRVTISPAPLGGFKITNAFPSQKITMRVLGGLAKNTPHTVSILDSKNVPIYSWSFTTSDEQPESSTGEVSKIQEQTVNQFYPLFDYVPYKTSSFTVDYTGRLTLEVKIIGKKTPQIVSQVENWMRKYSVEPSSHTIIYKEL